MNGWDVIQAIMVIWALIGCVELIHRAKKEREEDKKRGIDKHFWEY